MTKVIFTKRATLVKGGTPPALDPRKALRRTLRKRVEERRSPLADMFSKLGDPVRGTEHRKEIRKKERVVRVVKLDFPEKASKEDIAWLKEGKRSMAWKPRRPWYYSWVRRRRTALVHSR